VDSEETSLENLQTINKLLQEFLFGTAYGILMFLYCLLLHRSTVDKFQDFLQLFQLFSESHGGRLIEKTVTILLSLPHVEAKLSTFRAKKVMSYVISYHLFSFRKSLQDYVIHMDMEIVI